MHSCTSMQHVSVSVPLCLVWSSKQIQAMCWCREAQATLRDDVQRQLQRRSLPDWIDPCSGMWPARQAEQFAGLALRHVHLVTYLLLLQSSSVQCQPYQTLFLCVCVFHEYPGKTCMLQLFCPGPTAAQHLQLLRLQAFHMKYRVPVLQVLAHATPQHLCASSNRCRS